MRFLLDIVKGANIEQNVARYCANVITYTHTCIYTYMCVYISVIIVTSV
jgi:hypothetical protein